MHLAKVRQAIKKKSSFWPERRFVNPDSSRLLSAAYLPIVPKVASDVSPKSDCAEDSLIPAKLDTEDRIPPILSPKIEEIIPDTTELPLPHPHPKLERIPLEAKPFSWSNNPGVLPALSAIPPTNTGRKALIALDTPDSLSPS